MKLNVPNLSIKKYHNMFAEI